MDQEKIIPEEPNGPSGYVPRPRWQVWLARIGLVVFLILLFCYYYLMFSRGGA